ncbi:hypothetical protein DIZ27_38310 [Streptomyces sp. NWU339]|nr:hypothetical protein DIZ27_38310 [Streptomyces sp. NWU339]
MSFQATVRSERLCFTEEPRTAVSFPGAGERESTSHSDRINLPDRVVPGRQYDNVTVTYRLATRFVCQPDRGQNGLDHKNTR